MGVIKAQLELTAPPMRPPSKIMVLHSTQAMGWSMMAVPLGIALRKNFEHADISFAGSKFLVQSFDGNPHRIKAYDVSAGENSADWGEVRFTVSNTDTILATDTPENTGLIATMFGSGANYRQIAAMGALSDFHSVTHRFPHNSAHSVGEVRYIPRMYLDFMRLWGIEEEGAGLTVWPSPLDHSHAEGCHATTSKYARKAFFHLSASENVRMWPLTGYAEVARRLLTRYRDLAILVLVAGRLDMNQYYGFLEEMRPEERERISSYSSAKDRATITQFAAFLKGCDLFVGNDSGPAHVAHAAQVPSVVVFGNRETESNWFYPRANARAVVVKRDGGDEGRVLEAVDEMAKLKLDLD